MSPAHTWHTYATRDAWLAARQKTIGSSDAPVILGIGHMADSGASKSLFELWCEKTGRVSSGGEDSLRLRLGRNAEALVRQELQRALGRRVHTPESFLPPAAFEPSAASMAIQGFRSATPDGGVDGNPAENPEIRLVPAELKTVEAIAADDWSAAEPSRYSLVQLHHQMGVLDVDHGYIAALIGWSRFYHYRIERNNDLLEVLWAAEEDFWQHVQSDTPPEPDASESTRKALKKLYPLDSGEEIRLPGWAERYDQYRVAKEAAEEWKAQADQFKADLALAMKDASYALLLDAAGEPVSRFSYKTKKGYHMDAFDVAAQRTGPTEVKLSTKGKR